MPPSTSSQITEWVQRATKFAPVNLKEIESPLAELDAHLTLRSYIVGHSLTDADTAVWAALRNNKVAYAYAKNGLMQNLTRWFRFIEELYPQHVSTLAERPKPPAVADKKGGTAGEGGSSNYDIGLLDTEKGVVTRFPPEPSGYLHIGHAKAALLNDYFAHQKYKGTLILRFDDTNPLKEKQEYQDAIIEDLALMGVKADKTTYTSDYFKELYEHCVQMLREGNAYADDTLQEQMRKERMDGIASKRRDEKPEDSLARFEEMKKGTDEGKRWFIRAKISVDNPNKAMRDPVIYRCNDTPHHRTGDAWKIYPTYDFCCPIVDAMEGVTHALRTTEYKDRDPQYQWMLKALNLRNVYNWDFSRLVFVRTLLSKRKLTKLVDAGAVWGWDDPRMPTVRGIRRRGMTIPALQEFILKQGPSKNIVMLDWTIFWSTNKKHIDPHAARYTAVTEAQHAKATVTNPAQEGTWTEERKKHDKYQLGTKTVVYSKNLLLDQDDAASFEADEEITLMNWGNAFVRKIDRSSSGSHVSSIDLELNPGGDPKKTKKKITWLSADQDLVPVEQVDFDYLITKDKLEESDELEDFLTKQTEFRTKALADCNVANLKVDDIMQFDRKGYFRVDRAFVAAAEGRPAQPAVLFQIPTGKAK
jgi:glutamyl-tRNA synthetase